MQALHQPLATPHDLPLNRQIQAERIQISLPADANKENHPPIHAKAASVESCDLSLADELNAVKRKLERLRLERERTEQMLKERDMILELRMKELLQRSKEQRDLEMEVDRLFRLKELRLYCMRISPIRSLREKEREKIFADAQFPEYEIGDGEESVGENSSLDSSEFVTGASDLSAFLLPFINSETITLLFHPLLTVFGIACLANRRVALIFGSTRGCCQYSVESSCLCIIDSPFDQISVGLCWKLWKAGL
ncbi:hypothetical protein SDJN03_04140, partial [Cucurbita argyrosperma subsp. sororia]